MSQMTISEFRSALMALAEALSEPGRRFTPDEVMVKGHELNPGQYGPHVAPQNNASPRIHFIFVICSPSIIYEWTSLSFHIHK